MEHDHWLANAAVNVEYSASKIELILLLRKALLADELLDQLVRGWRSPEKLISQLSYPVESQSLRRRASEINRPFRTAAKKSGILRNPPLITSKRKLGMRLSFEFDLRIPQESSKQSAIERPTIFLPSGEDGAGFLSVPITYF